MRSGYGRRGLRGAVPQFVASSSQLIALFGCPHVSTTFFDIRRLPSFATSCTRAADDRLPKRLHEPLLKGPLSDKKLPQTEVRSIVTEYYAERGWDTTTGAPLLGTLEALEIAQYAELGPGWCRVDRLRGACRPRCAAPRFRSGMRNSLRRSVSVP
jgi:hypothetical protein